MSLDPKISTLIQDSFGGTYIHLPSKPHKETSFAWIGRIITDFFKDIFTEIADYQYPGFKANSIYTQVLTEAKEADKPLIQSLSLYTLSLRTDITDQKFAQIAQRILGTDIKKTSNEASILRLSHKHQLSPQQSAFFHLIAEQLPSNTEDLSRNKIYNNLALTCKKTPFRIEFNGALDKLNFAKEAICMTLLPGYLESNYATLTTPDFLELFNRGALPEIPSTLFALGHKITDPTQFITLLETLSNKKNLIKEVENRLEALSDKHLNKTDENIITKSLIIDHLNKINILNTDFPLNNAIIIQILFSKAAEIAEKLQSKQVPISTEDFNEATTEALGGYSISDFQEGLNKDGAFPSKAVLQSLIEYPPATKYLSITKLIGCITTPLTEIKPSELKTPFVISWNEQASVGAIQSQIDNRILSVKFKIDRKEDNATSFSDNLSQCSQNLQNTLASIFSTDVLSQFNEITNPLLHCAATPNTLTEFHINVDTETDTATVEIQSKAFPLHDFKANLQIDADGNASLVSFSITKHAEPKRAEQQANGFTWSFPLLTAASNLVQTLGILPKKI